MMKNSLGLSLVSFAMILFCQITCAQDSELDFKIDLLKEKISIDNNTYKGTFSDDFNEFFFFKKDLNKYETYVPYKMEYSNGKWGEPQFPFYYDPKFSYTYHALKPKSTILVFCSNKPNSADKSKFPNYSLWMVDTGNPASEPIELGPENLFGTYITQPSITNDGTIYFMSISSDWSSRTAYSMNLNEGAGKLAIPFEVVNNWQSNPRWRIGNFSVHPNKKLMALCIRELVDDEWQPFDLFISTNTDGRWSKPSKIQTSGVNTSSIEAFPYITHDGKYLFFTRDMSEINWIKLSD